MGKKQIIIVVFRGAVESIPVQVNNFWEIILTKQALRKGKSKIGAFKAEDFTRKICCIDKSQMCKKLVDRIIRPQGSSIEMTYMTDKLRVKSKAEL
ncbi:MAG: hypothetical protein K0S36_2162 [Nitrosospira multiformis]|jgi:hypothetical protein|nr:hypothetical protein [Nitrosospira multiformis]